MKCWVNLGITCEISKFRLLCHYVTVFSLNCLGLLILYFVLALCSSNVLEQCCAMFEWTSQLNKKSRKTNTSWNCFWKTANIFSAILHVLIAPVSLLSSGAGLSLLAQFAPGKLTRRGRYIWEHVLSGTLMSNIQFAFSAKNNQIIISKLHLGKTFQWLSAALYLFQLKLSPYFRTDMTKLCINILFLTNQIFHEW